ncbi:MAG TPA: UDP-glucose/GDP-mannose dehydrogenase family protein [Phycisphaerae bacterium]|nr:UDP-glucose/GDP-mannose dehydrogenase family protein [Phycisphaerae bacterium]HRR85113.1 UDP-glucose/GDP-mannose dehydrogenase family protein [Phycisphaerae bacterium]
MRLTVIGTGYVGLVTGACLADTGNEVVGVDKDAEKINTLTRGECPIYEPGLSELLQANTKAGRLRFTADIPKGIEHGDVVFIAVGTPPRDDGSSDMTAVREVADNIADHADRPKIVVLKSTVPIGTGDEIEERINRRAKHRVNVVNNPEFLKEGTAVEDFLRPDRVVIGAEDPQAASVIRELHEPFVRNQRPIYIMHRKAAEMSKYAANSYLAARISFINQIANVCDALGIDVNEVRLGMGSDRRIGFQFLYPGAGYGGSCFPKDVQSLVHTARKAGVQADLLDSVHQVNERQREILFRKIVARFGGSLNNYCFAIWGVSFKPKTDDIREAPAVTTINKLLEAGAAVRAHDPIALPNLRKLLGDRITYHESGYEALDGADALVIVTEWNEFRSPTFEEIRRRLRQPIIFDGRNLYSLDAMRNRDFEYYSIGRPAVIPTRR